ncbi:PepSY domain-containing protein [uncultured Vagococcus sp.]|uniref:PepSY domain-containing protein n=1 Tax=uncultured Vagococcus sp. TaxID=189676 RepID=UPI0028D63F2D|nr:PepSY domain-containing protein [uncultured Vagococcus sp.]
MRKKELILAILALLFLGVLFIKPVKSTQLTSMKSVVNQIGGPTIEIHAIKLTRQGNDYRYEVSGIQNQKSYHWLINGETGTVIKEPIQNMSTKNQKLQLDKDILFQNLSVIAEVAVGKGVATAWELSGQSQNLWRISVENGQEDYVVTIDNNTLAIESVNLI